MFASSATIPGNGTVSLSLPRFFLPNHQWDEGTDFSTTEVSLTGPEAHHFLNVLRGKVGDTLEVFDGAGHAAQAIALSCTRRDVRLRLSESRFTPPAQPDVTIATAVPKGDRFDWLVEKLTELGVRRLIPLTTSRSSVDPRDSKLDRLRQTVIAACKQSGRNTLLEISPVTPFVEAVMKSTAQLVVAHPPDHLMTGGEQAPVGSQITREAAFSWLGLVGPEGGFTSEELALTRTHSARFQSCGPHILRTETAALALATLLMTRRGPSAHDA